MMNTELFDERAHRVVAELLDNAEDRLIRTGRCTLANVSDYLTLEYIRQAVSLLEHGAVYLDSDGRSAADIFLSKIAFGQAKTKLYRNSPRYARHLQQHEGIYFPNFRNLLRLAYLNLIQSECELDRLMRSGLILLAARTLPGVAIDIRREFRLRGLEYDRTLFLESKMEQPNVRTTRILRIK